MSKSYQYFARKRGSHRYFVASTPCKMKQSHNHITCKLCLFFAGTTRQKQQNQQELTK